MEPCSTRTPSLGPPVVAQVQGLLAGDAPVVRLLAHLVVLQSGLVVHRQPLDGVCGQSLEPEEQLGLDSSRMLSN